MIKELQAQIKEVEEELDGTDNQVLEAYKKYGLIEGEISKENFDKVAEDLGLPRTIGYLAWHLNEGTGSGIDLFIEALELKLESKLQTLKSCLALAEKDKEDKIEKIDELINRDTDYLSNTTSILTKLKTSLFGDEK